MKTRRTLRIVILVLGALSWGVVPGRVQSQAAARPRISEETRVAMQAGLRSVTPPQRRAAAARAAAARAAAATPSKENQLVAVPTLLAAPTPGGTPDYFGIYPNYANSPIIQKFLDSLPGLGSLNANNLGQYLPIANPDTITYPGSDYYEIGLVQYTGRCIRSCPQPHCGVMCSSITVRAPRAKTQCRRHRCIIWDP